METLTAQGKVGQFVHCVMYQTLDETLHNGSLWDARFNTEQQYLLEVSDKVDYKHKNKVMRYEDTKGDEYCIWNGIIGIDGIVYQLGYCGLSRVHCTYENDVVTWKIK